MSFLSRNAWIAFWIRIHSLVLEGDHLKKTSLANKQTLGKQDWGRFVAKLFIFKILIYNSVVWKMDNSTGADLPLSHAQNSKLLCCVIYFFSSSARLLQCAWVRQSSKEFQLALFGCGDKSSGCFGFVRTTRKLWKLLSLREAQWPKEFFRLVLTIVAPQTLVAQASR